MKKTKIRRPRINPEVRPIIVRIYQQNPNLNSKQVWERLTIEPDRQWRVPSLRSVHEIYTKVKGEKNKPEFQELEQLWQLGLLAQPGLRNKYPELTAEAIGYILNVQKWAEKKGIERVGEHTRHGMTLRQALWVARLYSVIRKHINASERQLWRVSWFYAAYEIKCTLVGNPVDTWELDRALRNGAEALTLLIWNTLGSASEQGFDAEYILHTASQSIQPRKMRSIKDLAEEAAQRVNKFEKEIERRVNNNENIDAR